MKGKRTHPLAARIKRIMQTDEDVGKIAQATPALIGRALELFLNQICNKSASIAQNYGAKTLNPSHIKAYVLSDSLMDFLKETVESAPDLEEPTSPKSKRQRTSGGAAASGGAGAHGRAGRGRAGGAMERGSGRGRGRRIPVSQLRRRQQDEAPPKEPEAADDSEPEETDVKLSPVKSDGAPGNSSHPDSSRPPTAPVVGGARGAPKSSLREKFMRSSPFERLRAGRGGPFSTAPRLSPAASPAGSADDRDAAGDGGDDRAPPPAATRSTSAADGGRADPSLSECAGAPSGNNPSSMPPPAATSTARGHDPADPPAARPDRAGDVGTEYRDHNASAAVAHQGEDDCKAAAADLHARGPAADFGLPMPEDDDYDEDYDAD